MRPLAIALALVALCPAAGCDAVRRWGDDPLQDQHSVQPHERPLRSVPAGVVPTDDTGSGLRVAATLEPAQSYDEATALTNPLAASPEALRAGRVGYDRYCSHCHGDLGYGWTSVGSSLDPRPPDLALVAETRTDGELFAIITYGKVGGLSPRLGPTIEVDDRWRIIHYVRTLRRERQGKAPGWDQRILED